MCHAQVFAIGLSVMGVVRQIVDRREGICRSLKEVGLAVPYSIQSLSWEELSAKLDEVFHSLLIQLEDLGSEMGMVIDQLKILWLENSSEQLDQKILLNKLARLKARIANFDAMADEAGVNVFILLQDVGIAESIRNILLELEEACDTPEKLIALGRGFRVANPEAILDWASLDAGLAAQISEIENAFMETIIESQGFDAVKQVVQKRSKELEVWQVYGGYRGFGEAQSAEFEQGRQTLLQELTRKLVTEQERLAYEVFFGHVLPRSTASMDTEEINFF